MYCVQVLDKTLSAVGRSKDTSKNFTIVSGNYITSKINEVSTTLAISNVQTQIAEMSEIVPSIQTQAVVVPEITHSLHVYVSGRSIPLVLAYGSSEGWCTAKTSGNDTYTVSALKYVVAYNWPSDGVSLCGFGIFIWKF